MRLVDANDVVVGGVLDIAILNSQVVAKVPYRFGPFLFILDVTTTHLAGPSYTTYFETPDCSGSPVLAQPGPPDLGLMLFAVGYPGHTVYIPDLTDTPRYGTVQARRRVATLFEDAGADCVPSNADIGAISALPLIDLDTLYTGPFTMR